MIRRRGMTLVELLVTIAIGGIVLAMAFQAWLATSRATDATNTRLALRQHGMNVVQRVERVLRFRVPPAEVIVPAGQAPPAEVFQADRIAVVSTALSDETTRARVLLVSETDADSVADRLMMGQGPLTADATTEATEKVGPSSDKFRTEVRFRYGFDWDGKVAWNDTATSAPDLVRISLRTWPRDERRPRFEDATDHGGRPLGLEFDTVVRMP